jgi:hypothetical protein
VLSHFYAQVVADLSYFEAWQLWMSGKSTIGNDLFGIPMIWWGRGGKVVAFLAGLTVVLDAVGPERIRRWSESRRDFELSRSKAWRRAFHVTLAFVGAWELFSLPVYWNFPMTNEVRLAWQTVSAISGLVMVLCLTAVTPQVARSSVRLFARLLEKPVAESVIRWSAIVLFVIGFHFDLLAS